MALPIVKSLEECSSFQQTVSPYIGQLYTLPQELLQSWSDPQELLNIYQATNPLVSAFAFSLFLAPVFLLVSEINKNYSQVDRCWSFLPTIYNAHFVFYAHLSGLPTARLDNLLACSVVWSLRLTFNYWRKGGYSIGSEDYRWEVVRKYINSGLFFIFNILFISLAQSVLLFLITTPTYLLVVAAKHDVPLTVTDTVFPRLWMGLILLELFADQQQWDYQNAKQSYLKNAKVPPKYKQDELDRGFCTSGLWAWSRHPNFAAEQSIWMVLYQWSCLTTGTMWNWTVAGAMSYLILFQGSTWLTELLTKRKYPQYAEYQKRVGKFVPKFAGGLSGDPSDVPPITKIERKETKKKGTKK
ncbi:MAG: hypothetical protein M1818_007572 [Claussenomyces sp. TS43310]|nr:MAG: hypothetical protein M1818_007572 [Claussenomyces sp. TS43310]